MDVLSKIVTALKGGIAEAGEAIVDRQALRILEQEIRDALEALNQSKDALASTIAQQKLSEEKAKNISKLISENEGYAIKALDKADENLAKDVATKIVALENKLATEKQTGNRFASSAEKMRYAIANAEQDLQYMKNQVDTVKATENVQRAEAAVSERHSGTNSKLRTAMESLERIKEKQAMSGAQVVAAAGINNEENEVSEQSLERRLIDAGIKDSNNADDVLARLKHKST